MTLQVFKSSSPSSGSTGSTRLRGGGVTARGVLDVFQEALLARFQKENENFNEDRDSS